MTIKIDCPRCKQNLLVPNKKAGSYAACPRCGGRFWIPDETGGDGPSAEAIATGGAEPGRPAPESAVAAAPPAAPRNVATFRPVVPAPPPVPSAARSSPAAAAPLPPSTVSPPPPAPKGGRKIARFISAEAADSVVKPAADGRLPGLQLQEGGGPREAQAEARSVNPLLLYGAITLSAVVSILLVLGPDWGASGQNDSTAKEQARRLIEQNFFGGGSVDPGALKPYQEALRAAKLAHARGDRKTECACYEKVLKMLHADRMDERPLTGDGETGRESDKKLELYVETILKGT